MSTPSSPSTSNDSNVHTNLDEQEEVWVLALWGATSARLLVVLLLSQVDTHLDCEWPWNGVDERISLLYFPPVKGQMIA